MYRIILRLFLCLFEDAVICHYKSNSNKTLRDDGLLCGLYKRTGGGIIISKAIVKPLKCLLNQSVLFGCISSV